MNSTLKRLVSNEEAESFALAGPEAKGVERETAGGAVTVNDRNAAGVVRLPPVMVAVMSSPPDALRAERHHESVLRAAGVSGVATAGAIRQRASKTAAGRQECGTGPRRASFHQLE